LKHPCLTLALSAVAPSGNQRSPRSIPTSNEFFLTEETTLGMHLE
jgi:hypothetical protein